MCNVCGVTPFIRVVTHSYVLRVAADLVHMCEVHMCDVPHLYVGICDGSLCCHVWMRVVWLLPERISCLTLILKTSLCILKRVLSILKRALSVLKRALLIIKRASFILKRVIQCSMSLVSFIHVRNNSCVARVYWKEPYIHSKEPYLYSKEPYLYSKELFSAQRVSYPPLMWETSHVSHVHTQKSPICTQKSFIYTQKSLIHTQRSYLVHNESCVIHSCDNESCVSHVYSKQPCSYTKQPHLYSKKPHLYPKEPYSYSIKPCLYFWELFGTKRVSCHCFTWQLTPFTCSYVRWMSLLTHRSACIVIHLMKSYWFMWWPTPFIYSHAPY